MLPNMRNSQSIFVHYLLVAMAMMKIGLLLSFLQSQNFPSQSLQ